MSEITYDASRFPPGYASINGSGQSLLLNRIQLAHAVMTVGCSGYGMFRDRGFWRMAQLLCMTYSSVESVKSKLCLSDAYQHLEKSEKDGISYSLGMGLAKVFAEQLLLIPWLSHVKDNPALVPPAPKPRAPAKCIVGKGKKAVDLPDLVGRDLNGVYHLFEAKGSSGGLSKARLQHAIDQVSQVNSVNGVPPGTRVACYGELSRAGIHVHLVDPDDENGVKLQLSESLFLKDYYHLFVADERWVSAPIREVFGIPYHTRALGIPDMSFGIRADVLEWARSGKEYIGFEDLRPENQTKLDFFSGEAISLSLDGTALFGTPEQL